MRLAFAGIATALMAASGTARAQEASATAPAGDGPLDGVYERGVVEVEPSIAPIELVVIENHLGDVRVEGHDGDTVVIHALKRAPDGETLERLKVSLVPDPNGIVRIGSRVANGAEMRPLRAGSVRIDLIVQAPRDAAVEGRVWNGGLTVSGMENGAELSANEGDILVESSSGRIVTSSSMGSQRIHEVVGEVDARGLYGEVALDVVRGQRLAAMLHEGRVVARRVRSTDVSIHVTRGDIIFSGHPQVGGRWSVVTYRGNIEVSLEKRAPFTIAARARRGTVQLPKPVQAAREDGSGWIRGASGKAPEPAQMKLAAHIGNIAVSF